MEQLTELADLEVVDHVVEQVTDTAPGEIELSVELRRLPRALDRAGRDRARPAGVRDRTDVGIEQKDEPPPAAVVGGLADDRAAVVATSSGSEARLVLAERRVVHALWSSSSRATERRNRPA